MKAASSMCINETLTLHFEVISILNISDDYSRSISMSANKWVEWLLQHRTVLPQGFTFILLLFLSFCLRPACSCRTDRTGSIWLGLVRVGPQTQWPTFSSCRLRRLRLQPPSPHLASTTLGPVGGEVLIRRIFLPFSQICCILLSRFFLSWVLLLFFSVSPSALQLFFVPPCSSFFSSWSGLSTDVEPAFY